MKSSTGETVGSAPPLEPADSQTANPAPSPAPAPSRIADLKIRVLSALVMAPLVLLAVWAGGWVFRALLVVAALLAVREWVKVVAPDRTPDALWQSWLGIAVVAVAYALGGLPAALVFAVAVGFLVQAANAGRASRLLGVGVPYVAIGAVSLAWLREDPSGGLSLLFFVLLAIWATDIGAYAAGRSIGGAKLAPRISPKKTWAGLGGGMIAAAAVCLILALAVDAGMPVLAMLLGAVLAVVGQAGDLFESWVKRRFDVKDSGHLIPGHGGLLDRVDGLITAAPVLVLFQTTLGARMAWW